MNSKEFNKIVADTILSTADLLIKKGGEYSSEEDQLSNFKSSAKDLRLTPLQIALVYSHKHFSAICNYVRKDAKGLTQNLSEPIEGRIDDLINYCFLLKALIKDSQPLVKTEEPLPTIQWGAINEWTKQPPFDKDASITESLKKEPYND